MMRRFHRNELSVSIVLVFAWTTMAGAQESTPRFAVPGPVEPIPLKPSCDNCRMEGGAIYECAHFTPDPQEPCSHNRCIENRWISAVCDHYPDGSINLCGAIDSSNPADWLVQQQLRFSIGGCFTTDLGDYHEVVRIIGDCHSCPQGAIVLSGRCVTDAVFCAGGPLLETAYRGIRRICGCIPDSNDLVHPIHNRR